jgi:hypothetical protein
MDMLGWERGRERWRGRVLAIFSSRSQAYRTLVGAN